MKKLQEKQAFKLFVYNRLPILFQIGKPSLPAFTDIFIDAFHHNDQVTPGRGVRMGGRIIGGYLEGAFFKQLFIKDQTSQFGMEQFYLGPETVVENEHVSTSLCC